MLLAALFIGLACLAWRWTWPFAENARLSYNGILWALFERYHTRLYITFYIIRHIQDITNDSAFSGNEFFARCLPHIQFSPHIIIDLIRDDDLYIYVRIEHVLLCFFALSVHNNKKYIKWQISIQELLQAFHLNLKWSILLGTVLLCAANAAGGNPCFISD